MEARVDEEIKGHLPCTMYARTLAKMWVSFLNVGVHGVWGSQQSERRDCPAGVVRWQGGSKLPKTGRDAETKVAAASGGAAGLSRCIGLKQFK